MYYNTAIAIIGIINKDFKLVDINYIYFTLAKCYLGGQLPYNWFNIYKLFKIFYIYFIYFNKTKKTKLVTNNLQVF